MSNLNKANRAQVEKLMGEMPEADRKVIESFLKSGSKARRTGEAELRVKYPQVLEGSLAFDDKANKQFAFITCTHPGCEKQRRVFTSDLHQVTMCEDHKKEQVKAKKAARDAKVAQILKDNGIEL